MLFAHPCKIQLILGDIVTWKIQPTGDLLRYNGFYKTYWNFDYNDACLKLKDEKIVAVFCQLPGPVYIPKKPLKTVFVGVTCFISVIFFFLIILVYACLPALRNIHGKTLMCHVFSLGMAFFTLANAKLNPIVSPKMTYDSYYLRKTLGIYTEKNLIPTSTQT